MNFIFEDLENLENFKGCPDVNRSGIKRFATSPMANCMLYGPTGYKKFHYLDRPDNYIITTGVNHSPDDWTGSDLAYNNTRRSIFSHLNSAYLYDLQQGHAMILFDQSLEGYQTTWLWEYFHKDCDQFKINPEAVVYTTGNLLAKEQYKNWADEHGITKRLNVIPYSHFEADVFSMAEDQNIDMSFEKQITYKQQHLADIKSYNCLQKRLRAHRIWFYIYLYKDDLLDHGLVSMNKYDHHANYFEGRHLPDNIVEEANTLLPLLVYGKNNNEHDDNFYIRRILDNVCLDTWVSVVSEASFSDYDHTLFLSEKVFKPIACFHPFIVVGNKGSLKELRKLGYKTFDGFIDESYDDLPTFERYDAIIESIKKIIAIEDKVSWYKSMEDILIHNYETLKRNAKQFNPAHAELEKTYNRYFGKENA